MSDDQDGYIDRNKKKESCFGSFLSYFRRAWSQFDFIIIQCHAQSFFFYYYI